MAISVQNMDCLFRLIPSHFNPTLAAGDDKHPSPSSLHGNTTVGGLNMAPMAPTCAISSG